MNGDPSELQVRQPPLRFACPKTICEQSKFPLVGYPAGSTYEAKRADLSLLRADFTTPNALTTLD